MSHLRFAHLPLAATLLATPAFAQTWDVAPLVVEGDPIAGGLVNTIRNLAINDSLDWRVEAQLQVGPSFQTVIVSPLGVVAAQDQALGQPFGATIAAFDALTLDAAGNSAVNYALNNTLSSDDNSGIFYNLGLVIQESDVSTAAGLTPGSPYTSFLETKLGDNGDILMIATVNDPALPGVDPQVLMRLTLTPGGDLATETVEYKVGDTLPGTTATITAFRPGPHNFDMNDSGVVMFACDTNLASGADGFILLNDAVIAQEGQPSPLPGRNWQSVAFTELTLNNAGGYAYNGTLDGPSASNILLVKNGAPFRLEGDPVPGLPSFNLTSFGNGPLDLADTGELLWYGDWDAPTAFDTGLFVDDQLIVQEGISTVGGVVIDTLLGAVDSYFISDDGAFVIFEAILENGDQGAFLATRPGSAVTIPGCSSDGSTLALVGGAAVSGGSLDLQLFSPSLSSGLRFLAVAGVNVLDGSGCGVFVPGVGEILIGFTPPNPFTLPAGMHTGGSGVVTIPVPSSIALVGSPRYVQAYYLFPSDPANLFDLTNALEITVGL